MLMEGAALLSQLYADEHMGSGSLYTLPYTLHILISDVLFMTVSALLFQSFGITVRANLHVWAVFYFNSNAVPHAVQFNQTV